MRSHGYEPQDLQHHDTIHHDVGIVRREEALVILQLNRIDDLFFTVSVKELEVLQASLFVIGDRRPKNDLHLSRKAAHELGSVLRLLYGPFIL